MKLNCKRIDFTYTPGEEIWKCQEMCSRETPKI